MKTSSSIISMVLMAAVLLLSVPSTAPLTAHPTKASTAAAKKVIKIKNGCKFSVDEIYIADPADHSSWGYDILDPDEVLMPGEVIEVKVDCGIWDVKLVAKDGSTCELHGIRLCDSGMWVITPDCH